MLAIDGDNCLLGRQSRFIQGMWSCLAGFCEPGETLEEATRRETLEEAGIRCGKVKYFRSQPWPFPMNLMVGVHAEAISRDITVDRSELEAMFQPIQIGKLTIRNRIVSTAHAEVYAEGGMTTERYIRYYEEKAKGGVGLAICGGSSPVAIDSPRLVELGQPGRGPVIRASEPGRGHAQARRQDHDPGHPHGPAHRLARRDWPHLRRPSGIREPVHRGNAKTIEIEEIRRIVGDYGRAAKRVKAAGLDGIEMSAAHQHMIDQFWSPRVNHRTDEYGGSSKTACASASKCSTPCASRSAPDFCVGLRMCGDEFHEDGISHEWRSRSPGDAESGLIDFISVVGSGATPTTPWPTACRRWRCRPSLSCIWPPASSRCRRCR